MLLAFLQQATAPQPDPDFILAWLQYIHKSLPLFGVLLVMIAFDVLTGYAAAFITKTVSSTASLRGMVKKALIMILVTVCRIIEPYSGEVPLSKLVSMAFIVLELTSIVENVARAGVPIPVAITDALAALKSAVRQKPSVPLAGPSVTINRANSVDIHADSVPGDSKSGSVVINSADQPKPLIPTP